MKFPFSKHVVVRSIVAGLLLASLMCSSVLAVVLPAAPNLETSKDQPVLTKFTTDLTQLGRDGRLRENLSFEAELDRLVKVLGQGGVRQPVIVDNGQGVQETIVEQLALRIASGSAPAELVGRTILKVETATLFSSARSQKDAAQAIDDIVNKAADPNNRIILYFDELTSFVGPDAPGKLLDLISAGKLTVIGGSSAATFDQRIESHPEIAMHFEKIGVTSTRQTVAGRTEDTAGSSDDEEYQGDNVSSDLRQMMAQDPTGQKRVDVIVQAKDADNPSFRSIMADGSARVSDRVGNSNTLVLNMPLKTVGALSTSGLINFISPDRPTVSTGHVENATGAAAMRAQPAANGKAAYTLDGSGVGIAFLDSGIYSGRIQRAQQRLACCCERQFYDLCHYERCLRPWHTRRRSWCRK